MMLARRCRRLLAPLVLAGGMVLGAGAGRAQVLASSLIYTSIQPCRVIDTRLAGGPLAANSSRAFNVVGVGAPGSLDNQGGNAGGCPVPGFAPRLPPFPQVQAVFLNLVAVSKGGGYLVAWPSDQPRPATSALDYAPSLSLANGVVVPVRQDSQGADITLAAVGSATQVVADVLGYFSTESVPEAFNVFLGRGAGQQTDGGYNTAVGDTALSGKTTGLGNTAYGWGALGYGTGGSGNTGVGLEALVSNVTGSRNVAVGNDAGWLSLSGDNNVYLASEGGEATESNTIRIGRSFPGTFNPAAHTRTFIGGINGATSASGTAVLIDFLGQLGTATSSLRFKEDVADMGEASAGLMRLRPVTFHYREGYDDGSHLLQYGLVAEEVARVFPDLVQYDGAGQPLAVRYHFVNAMLLNEVQRQHARLAAQDGQLAAQDAQLTAQGARLAAQEARLARQQGEIDELRTALARLQAAAQP